MSETLPPWLDPVRRSLFAALHALPHGLLLCGPPGVGKRLLAEALAARLLCTAARADEPACGECAGCRLRLAGNHPDAHLIVPEASLEAPEETPEGKPGKASTQIVIDQIRRLQGALAITSHAGGRRTVILEPAEAMNPFTANALLKLLEEPPPATHLILVSANPRRLLPTLRSRCQQWPLAVPPAPLAQQWLVAHAGADAPGLLAICGGLPLEAARLAERGGAAALARFVGDLTRLAAPGDAIELAGRWEVWAKGKEGSAQGIGLPRFADWLQRWLSDLVALRAGLSGRYFPEHDEAMRRIAAPVPMPRLLDCYTEITQVRRSAGHPLNLRLAIEDMLLRYARTFSVGRK